MRIDMETAQNQLHSFRISTERLREARYAYHRELEKLCEKTGIYDQDLLKKLEVALRACETLEEAGLEFSGEIERVLEESRRLIPPQAP